MKLTTFLLFISAISVFANKTYSQTKVLNLNLKNSTLKEVFQSIETQSGFYFMYSEKLVDVEREVSINIKDKRINEVLDELFAGTNVSYKLKDRFILLTTSEIVGDELSVQQPHAISGKVTDSSGTALPGVTVVIKGTASGTITGADGSYSLINVPANAILQFSFIGMKTQEIPVAGESTIFVRMIEESIGIDEVVAIGYGTTTKRQLISAVSTIDTEKLQNLPIPTLGDGLAGRTAGIIVNTQGGGPGKSPTVSIRGGGTPLVVIDGIVTDYNDFKNINPNDIENFSVLKDAQATAIYGARAGDGILLITTKRGKADRLSVKYDYSYTFTEPTQLPEKLGSYDRALIINQALANDGQPAYYSDEVLQKFKDQTDPYNYPNTDWQKLTLKDYAPEQRHNLAITGGSEKTQFYTSVSFYDQGTLYKFNTNWLKRYTYRMTVSNHLDKIGLKTVASIYGTIQKERYPWSQYSSGYWQTWGHIQNSPPMDLAYTDLGLYSGKGDHPIVEIDPQSGYMLPESRNVNGMLNFEWSVPFVEGLKIKSISTYRLNDWREKAWMATAPQYALGSTNPSPTNPSQLRKSSTTGYAYTLQNLVDYQRTFLEKHSLSFTFGYEQSYSFSDNFWASREGYALPVDQFIAGPTDNLKNGATESEEGRAGYMGRLGYSFKNKYFIEGSLRHDGSDWFPKDNRWGTFYAGSAGWLISDEGFMQNLNERNIINSLKLRGSYGMIGQIGGISRFQYLTGYNLVERAYVVDGTWKQGFTEGPLVSPDISWYSINSSNIGVDFASLNSMLSGSVDYFYNRTTGYLASPSDVGYTDPLGIALPTVKSEGAFRRAGFEFSLNYKNRINELTYQVGVNYTYFDQLWENNPNEDLATLKNPAARTTHQTGYWGTAYINQGYYTSSEDVMNSPRRLGSVDLVPGDIKYKDVDGNGILDGSDFVRTGKNSFPRANYGFNIDLHYRGWFMNTLIQGSSKRDMYLGDVLRNQSSQSSYVYPFQLDYWTPENTNALYPRLLSNSSVNGNNNAVTSDFWLLSTGYVRLKTLQVGYDFKNMLKRNMPFISDCSLVFTGTNLLTFSKANKYYIDPENGSTNNYDYPVMRAYSFSIIVGF
ncbi:TonB-dependent receptor [Gaoshiqia sp. Z1-71]|uniref:TonB-dependent receptor n=1 Tax=Gaoshiqia hydrogeniformans TaxID=3290090 RepID=UPI003BF7A4B5